MYPLAQSHLSCGLYLQLEYSEVKTALEALLLRQKAVDECVIRDEKENSSLADECRKLKRDNQAYQERFKQLHQEHQKAMASTLAELSNSKKLRAEDYAIYANAVQHEKTSRLHVQELRAGDKEVANEASHETSTNQETDQPLETAGICRMTIFDKASQILAENGLEDFPYLFASNVCNGGFKLDSPQDRIWAELLSDQSKNMYTPPKGRRWSDPVSIPVAIFGVFAS